MTIWVVNTVTTVKWFKPIWNTIYGLKTSKLYTYLCVITAAALNVYTFVILTLSVNYNAGETFMRSLIRTNKA
jgi:hypothetical protein